MNGAPTKGDGERRHKSVWGPLIRFVLSLPLPQTPKLVLLQLVSRAVPAIPEKQTARCRVSSKRKELAKAAGVTTSTVSHALKQLEKAGLVRRSWGRYEGRRSFRVYELIGKVGDALKFGVVEPPRKTFDHAAASTPEERGVGGECAAGSTVGVSPAAPTPCPQQHGGGASSSNPEVSREDHPEGEKGEVSRDARACALGAPRTPADGNGHNHGHGHNGPPPPSPASEQDGNGHSKNGHDSAPAFPAMKPKSPPKEMTPKEIQARQRFLRQQAEAYMRTEEAAKQSKEKDTPKAKASGGNGKRRRAKPHAA